MEHEQQMPPQAVMMQMVTGRWVAQTIGVAAELGLADLVHRGVETAEELARETKTLADPMYRVMRALASVGVFTETAPRRFAMTPLADTLRSDARGSVRAVARLFAHDLLVRAWADLRSAMETGKPTFDKITGMPGFQFFSANPEIAQLFNDAMSSFSSQETFAMLDAYDFGGIGTLVDVGGGHGFLLSEILKRNPTMRGAVFELPHVVDGAKALFEREGLVNRVEIYHGDAMDSVRPEGADAYLMKHIIHDWDDDRSIRFLTACGKAVKPGGKVLLVEMVLTPENEPHFSKWLDLEMLVVTQGGRERTREEYARLYERAGLTLTRVIPTKAPISILEGVRR